MTSGLRRVHLAKLQAIILLGSGSGDRQHVPRPAKIASTSVSVTSYVYAAGPGRDEVMALDVLVKPRRTSHRLTTPDRNRPRTSADRHNRVVHQRQITALRRLRMHGS